ncbi:hypothetical protein L208DRAFT_1380529 [Tricholoma matsutake]|nr:hypothetical protein L208DRAFT_1380529 [Tricholoma matsutake 945]
MPFYDMEDEFDMFNPLIEDDTLTYYLTKEELDCLDQEEESDGSEPVQGGERVSNPFDHPFSLANGPLNEATLHLGAEVLGLPGHLDECHHRQKAVAVSARAYNLHDTFLVNSPEPPAMTPLHMFGGRSIAAFLPLEDACCTSDEAATVLHMLDTAIVWMTSVPPSSVSPDQQELLASLTGQALEAATHFPRA